MGIFKRGIIFKFVIAHAILHPFKAPALPTQVGAFSLQLRCSSGLQPRILMVGRGAWAAWLPRWLRRSERNDWTSMADTKSQGRVGIDWRMRFTRTEDLKTYSLRPHTCDRHQPGAGHGAKGPCFGLAPARPSYQATFSSGSRF
jgi:hypothetical protein